MNVCKYRIPCNEVGCQHNHNYGDVLVEESMIANMYNQESMTRIMTDNKVNDMFEKQFEMAVKMQEASTCAQELLGTTSNSYKRSDYKSQQAAESREQGAVAKKLEVMNPRTSPGTASSSPSPT